MKQFVNRKRSSVRLTEIINKIADTEVRIVELRASLDVLNGDLRSAAVGKLSIATGTRELLARYRNALRAGLAADSRA
jgi:hypothetical protein